MEQQRTFGAPLAWYTATKGSKHTYVCKHTHTKPEVPVGCDFRRSSWQREIICLNPTQEKTTPGTRVSASTGGLTLTAVHGAPH